MEKLNKTRNAQNYFPFLSDSEKHSKKKIEAVGPGSYKLTEQRSNITMKNTIQVYQLKKCLQFFKILEGDVNDLPQTKILQSGQGITEMTIQKVNVHQ